MLAQIADRVDRREESRAGLADFSAADPIETLGRPDRGLGLVNLFWLAHTKDVAEILRGLEAKAPAVRRGKYSLFPLLSSSYRRLELEVRKDQTGEASRVHVHDNPALVEGQMRGGAVQGMGWALFEELAHDEDGRLVTGSFLDYAIPTAERVPEIETLIVEVPAPDGPFGAKGIGEAPVVGAPAAVANAVAAAIGMRLYELPMTAPRVCRAARS